MNHQGVPLFIWLVPLSLPALWCVVSFMLAFFSGWQRLAASYASDQAPHGSAFLWQSGSVGFVRYRNCINVHVAREGLFLSVPWLFRLGHKPLFVPWSAIHNPEARQVLWFQFTRFQIGEPSIAHVQIPTKVFEAERALA